MIVAVQFLDRARRLPMSAEQIASRFDVDGWLMTDAERSTLAQLLEGIRPCCAIEVGTFKAGSLSVLARYCEHVYTLDLDAQCKARYGEHFPNVDFIAGPSIRTLPLVLEEIRSRDEALGFVLVDADHSEAGVRDDIERILEHRPTVPLCMLIHDSFNPDCRRGILTANWASNPHVHFVELDYVVGRFIGHEEGRATRTMWYGFALAVLLPEPRSGAVRLHQNEELMFRTVYWRSVYPWQLPQRLWVKCRVSLRNMTLRLHPSIVDLLASLRLLRRR